MMLIKNYQFGRLTVGGNEYRSDLKIIEGKVIPSWWRQEGHVVDVADVDDILAAKPETLVVGRGIPAECGCRTPCALPWQVLTSS